MTKRIFVGVGVAVLKDGKILLGKRKNSIGAGTWAMPGGHLEFGESVEQCAVRELLEETGLEALGVQRGPWCNGIDSDSKQYITLFTIVDQFIGEPKLLEEEKCEGWFWFSLKNLPSPLFPPTKEFFENRPLA